MNTDLKGYSEFHLLGRNLFLGSCRSFLKDFICLTDLFMLSTQIWEFG